MNITGYDSFLRENRIKVNGYLNRVLWFFALAGPAIASGIKGGIFSDITYTTCICISAVLIIMACIHLLLFRKKPESIFTGVFALTTLDMLLAYMSYSHVSIFLTWFLVPLLSILFCNVFLYYYAFILNYILMLLATFLTAHHELVMRPEYNDVAAYYSDVAGGFTIESVVMFASGLMLLKLTAGYYKSIFEQHKKILQQDEEVKEKMGILDSMAEIYDNVNLIDFVSNTEMSLRDDSQTKHGIDLSAQTHTIMNERIRKQVMPDQIEEFLNFTNIKTIRSRLAQKKLISADFIDVVSGWFRAQYITVDSTLDGIPNIVIYTTRNVDEEKRREENLIRISMTDEMTRLFNRRCYDEDLMSFRKDGMSEDFVLFSIDVNGLKKVNDTKGHAAGDELIKGAADCLALSVGNNGKVYRTGGDEFMAVAHTSDPEDIRRRIKERAEEWHGVYTDEITMSIGYAAHSARPGASIDDLEHMADADMYAEKDRHYKERGIERRQH